MRLEVSIRQYFAARAPRAPAIWFEPNGLPARPVSVTPTMKVTWTSDIDETVTRLLVAECEENLSAFCDEMVDVGRMDAVSANTIKQVEAQLMANRTAMAEWEHEYAVQVSAQWPWAWADAVLAAGDVR